MKKNAFKRTSLLLLIPIMMLLQTNTAYAGHNTVFHLRMDVCNWRGEVEETVTDTSDVSDTHSDLLTDDVPAEEETLEEQGDVTALEDEEIVISIEQDMQGEIAEGDEREAVTAEDAQDGMTAEDDTAILETLESPEIGIDESVEETVEDQEIIREGEIINDENTDTMEPEN